MKQYLCIIICHQLDIEAKDKQTMKEGTLKDNTMMEERLKDSIMKEGTSKDSTMKEGTLKDRRNIEGQQGTSRSNSSVLVHI